MAKFRITRKLRQNNYALTVDGLGTSMSDFYKQWQAGGGAEKLGSFKDWYKGSNTGLAAKNAQLTANANARAAQRAANIANPGAAAAKAGYQRGANSVGIMGGLKNTWNKAGMTGKAGMVAGGLALGGLAAKGLFGGNNNNKQQ